MYTPQYTTASKEMEGPYHPPTPTAHHNVNSGERIYLYFPTEFKNTHIGFYPRYVTGHWGMKDGWKDLLIHNPPQMVDVCCSYIPGHPCFATTGRFAHRRNRTRPWHELTGVQPSLRADLPDPLPGVQHFPDKDTTCPIYTGHLVKKFLNSFVLRGHISHLNMMWVPPMIFDTSFITKI